MYAGQTGFTRMFDKYSPDEGFALIAGTIIGVASWSTWYYRLAAVGNRVRVQGQRWPLAFAPPVCALIIYWVLKRWSAEDVRNDPAYMLFYMVIGLAWVGLFRIFLPLYGLSPRDDVLERGNNAAGWAIVGALIGSACCFAGGNVGNGPGWWVVLFSGLLSTGALILLWCVLHMATGLHEKVTIERDLSAGLRAAGFFVGAGIILGRAVAGDWVSAAATTADFARMAWPALVLTGVAAVVERVSPQNLMSSAVAAFFWGLIPAFTYAVAGGFVMLAM